MKTSASNEQLRKSCYLIALQEHAVILPLIKLTNFVFGLLELAVVVDVILFYFVPPHNQFRRFLDRIVWPMLLPIRRVVPPIGGFDFSPLILILLLELARGLIIHILLLL